MGGFWDRVLICCCMAGVKGFSALPPTGGLPRPGAWPGLTAGPVGGLPKAPVDIGLTLGGGLMALGLPKLA